MAARRGTERRGWHRAGRISVWILGLALALFVTRESLASLHRVAGPSDAPTLQWGDLVLVHRAAYDLWLPGGRRVAATGRVRAGDMALIRVPGESRLALKRVVAGPGASVEVRGHRLIVDGEPARYEELPRTEFDGIPERNQLGPRVARERASGFEHLVTFDPGAPEQVVGPIVVPPDHWFVLGDNRDHSYDSRDFGPVPRHAILGRVIEPPLRRVSDGIPRQ